MSVFPFFPRDLRGSAERKILAFLGGFPCFSPKSKARKTRVQDLFETFSRLSTQRVSRLFRDFFQILGGSGAAGPRDTFFGLSWGFGPGGPRDPCKWSTGSQIYSTLSALEVYNNQSPTLPDLARHQQMAFSVRITPDIRRRMDARRPSLTLDGRNPPHTQGSYMPSFHSTWRGAPTQI